MALQREYFIHNGKDSTIAKMHFSSGLLEGYHPIQEWPAYSIYATSDMGCLCAWHVREGEGNTVADRGKKPSSRSGREKSCQIPACKASRAQGPNPACRGRSGGCQAPIWPVGCPCITYLAHGAEGLSITSCTFVQQTDASLINANYQNQNI